MATRAAGKKQDTAGPGVLRSGRGQSLPVVLMLGAILSLFAMSLLRLYTYEVKSMIKSDCITRKQELASLALEHVMYKLQQGSNWNDLGIGDYKDYSRAFKADFGVYAVSVKKGNLFLTDPDDPNSRQDTSNYRTIGIRVTTTPTNCYGAYYALVKRSAYGGPLVSKGKIDLPCTRSDGYDESISGKIYFNYGFYWGDVYSANPNDGFCRIPQVPVGGGDYFPQPWMPQVYARGNIYTNTNKDFVFAYVYDDMSPTAHSHPYSSEAVAPEVDLEYYKMLAKQNNAYYGPATVNGAANPYYVTGGNNDIEDVTNANIQTLVQKLTTPGSVLFIDTTDGNPLRYSPSAGRWNTYTGYLHVTMSANTLKFYKDEDNQYFTRGSLFVMGPFSFIGSDPEKGMGCASNCDDILNVMYPDNFYYPRTTDELYELASPPQNSKLKSIKHRGFIYAGGEFRAGGPGIGCKWKIIFTPPFLVQDCGVVVNPKSKIGIYGTVYIGENGSLTAETSKDDPELHIYYDNTQNMFGTTGDMLTVVNFNETTFLLP